MLSLDLLLGLTSAELLVGFAILGLLLALALQAFSNVRLRSMLRSRALNLQADAAPVPALPVIKEKSL